MKKGADTKAAAVPGELSWTGRGEAGPQPRKRPVYPFSIVPGGVVSREELKAAMKSDPMVAVHYAAVNVDRLRPVTLKQDLAAYVSFRMHGQVFWTSRKVRLAKGERLLQSDIQGAIGVRERCGNQVSEKPRLPVLALLETEPSDEILATPVPSLRAQPGRSEAAVAALPGAVEQGTYAEDAGSQVPAGGSGPVVYQGGGGGGGFVGGAGGGGASGGGGGAAEQPVSDTATSTHAAPDVLTDMAVVLPVLPPITTSPPPAAMGWTVTWISPLPTPPPASVPPTTWTLQGAPPVPVPVYPWVPLIPPPVVTPPVPPGVPEYPIVVPPGVPPTGPPVTVTPPPPGTPPGPPLTPPLAAVPEPSTWLMLGVGLGLLMLRGCQRSVSR
ncbi:MAG: PEP-CTERM sorting domain-containing protein [Acidobacteriota bacterium]|nr:PEP-CTERM sorting domain-containing protein [Acidobacteriota bacterium]